MGPLRHHPPPSAYRRLCARRPSPTAQGSSDIAPKRGWRRASHCCDAWNESDARARRWEACASSPYLVSVVIPGPCGYCTPPVLYHYRLRSISFSSLNMPPPEDLQERSQGIQCTCWHYCRGGKTVSLQTWLDHRPHRVRVVSLQEYLRNHDATQSRAAGPSRPARSGLRQSRNPRGQRRKRRRVESDSDSESVEARARRDTSPSAVSLDICVVSGTELILFLSE